MQLNRDYAPSPGEQGEIYIKILAQPSSTCGTTSVDINTCKYNFAVPVNQ
jgi:hypothetical protein